jgi:hypothetical protein
MSGSVTLSQYESQAFTLLRALMLAVLPGRTEVVRGQINRIPEPNSPNFVLMVPLLRERLETTITNFADNGTGITRTDLQPTRLTVQLDFHGPSAGDNAQIFTTLFRSDFAVNFFAQDTALPGAPVDVTPLDHSDPRQVPFINGEDQYEERWSVDAVMQVNPIVTTIIQSATAIAVGIIEVDATYPP